jgi:hypothetical protein
VLLVAHGGADRRTAVARATAHQPSVITVGLRGSLP